MSTAIAELDDSLSGAPSLYRTPARRPSLAEAQDWCKHLATTHYENFHVATFFLPASLRPHFHSVYAFCRTSDDLGDEVADTATATRLLGQWRAMLEQCFDHPEQSRHPVYVSLQPTIRQHDLPIEPFGDLISAFEKDQVYTHHESLATLEHYSRYSANPVGRLVLLVSGYRSEELMLLSDEICTGLQLANFYQDIVEDWARGRRYVPAEAMQRFGVTNEQIEARRFDANFRAMMEFLIADARTRLQRGSRIVALVNRDLAATLSLFVKGGLSILDAIAAQDYDTLKARPVVSKSKKLRLLGSAFAGKLGALLLPERRQEKIGMSEARSAELNAAYAHCRAIAKREAKNFYYAFVALPRHKSDAMCAVYAFMRKADDLSDDETLTLDARRSAMAEWTAGWRASVYGRTSDPILLAVHDTQSRFGIPDELLEQLVAGTTLDLEPQQGVSTIALNDAPYQAYETFDDLYRYCYLVASVVGLVCIRIFRYTDPRAELLAEHTGIAFQLTNILRDVREDAERGRIYLPLDDMASASTSPENLLLATKSGKPSPETLVLLRNEIARAQQYYSASGELIPLLAPDAQPAMRVLVSIYHRLLERIAASPASVFRERVSVPTPQKLAILAPGLLRSFVTRIFG